jgi:integrase/recombinase XerD
MKCPECGSKLLYRDGLRYLEDGSTVQRWLCRSCSYRFSESSVKLNIRSQITKRPNPENDLPHKVLSRLNLSLEKPVDNLPFLFCEDVASHKGSIAEQGLNSLRDYNRTRQVCVSDKKAKNLSATEIQQTVAGDIKAVQPKWTIPFLWALKKDGIQDNTAKTYWYYLTNLESRGADLADPESMKAAIANRNWDNCTKASCVTAYTKYLEVFGGTWKKPRYTRDRKVPYLATSKQLDVLIGGANKKLAAYLMVLRQTGMRAGEAFRLEWKDLDAERNMITLNKTEKHGTPRNFTVTPQLIAMLNSIPKTEARIFTGTLINFAKTFRAYRNRLSLKLQDPRLRYIHFHSFRHYFATELYAKTKSIRHVQERLGHKNIMTTEIYTHLVDFEYEGSYYSATAKTPEEAQKLIEDGFRYECDFGEIKVFRKPKGVL